MKARIRNFEFPQVFVSFDVTDHSLRYLNRRLREYSEEKIHPLTEIDDLDHRRSRVKIEERGFICESPDTKMIIQCLSINKSLHPIRLITLVRFLMLNNLDELPDRITKGFCLAWAGGNRWYKVCISKKTIEEDFNRLDITAEIPLIIESDPI